MVTKRAVVASAVTAVVGVTLAATLSASAASPAASPRPKPVIRGARYLALGDSVPFGFRESNNRPTPDYRNPNSLAGFAELVARDLDLKLTNAACPGETTGSMISLKRQSNGCWTNADGSPGYRQTFPLHVKYRGSQLNFAVNWLKHHPNTRLVTLMIGANDGFLCQERTREHCTSPKELDAVLARVRNNVEQILQRMRQGARYAGRIVIVWYYSLDYADSNQSALALALITRSPRERDLLPTSAWPSATAFSSGPLPRPVATRAGPGCSPSSRMRARRAVSTRASAVRHYWPPRWSGGWRSSPDERNAGPMPASPRAALPDDAVSSTSTGPAREPCPDGFAAGYRSPGVGTSLPALLLCSPELSADLLGPALLAAGAPRRAPAGQ